jgi:uncharacterized protein (DUF433 family)
MLTETRYEHVVLTEDGVPILTDTTMKVIELVLARIAYGWSAEELHFQFPHLSLGQIYSALAYYWDHRDAFEQEIERRLERVDQIQQHVEPSPLVARLKEKGLL